MKNTRQKYFQLRLTDEEFAEIKKKAREANMSVSAYVRQKALSRRLKQAHNGELIEVLSRLGRQQKMLCLEDRKNEAAYRAILQSISDAIVAIPYRIRKEEK